MPTEVTTTLLDGNRRARRPRARRQPRHHRAAPGRSQDPCAQSRVWRRASTSGPAQLESAIAELEAFSYSVSHDLRAPLRAINGYATILAEDHAADIGDDGLRCCDNIIGNTRRMGQLIDDLLSFSRLGRSRLAREPIDMTALAHSAYGEISDGETARSQVSLAIGDLAPATGDPTLLRQVWANLLSNALKFTADEPEPSHHRRRARQARRRGRLLRLRQRTGVRHAPLRQALPGVRAPPRRRVRGLRHRPAIVRRAVEAHGGRVWAESTPGDGATFSFALPAGPHRAGRR